MPCLYRLPNEKTSLHSPLKNDAVAELLALIVGGIAPRGTSGAGRRIAGPSPNKAMRMRFKKK
jgi:hypothetical protein